MKHIVGFSGGIDSQAAAGVVLDRYGPDDVILMNSDAGGNEDPRTTAFVRWYSENVHPVVEVHAIVADMESRPSALKVLLREGYALTDPLTFDMVALAKGQFPQRMSQFCTEFLKLFPQRRWIEHAFGIHTVEGFVGPVGQYRDEDYERYAGVRSDESRDRSHALPLEWDDYFDCYLNRPVLEWSKEQCFAFIIGRGELVNPLYSLGFSRVGCAPCINSNKNDILAWLQRAPEMIDKIRGYEQKVGRTYFAPLVPGMAINWIDDVVAWAQTSHGGRQKNMLRVLNDRPACESKYGLCE